MRPWSWLSHMRCVDSDTSARAGLNVEYPKQAFMTSPLGTLRRRVGLAVLGGLTLTALPLCEVHAQSLEQSLNAWANQPTLTGDWGGLRTQLTNDGVNVYGNILGQAGDDVAGGKRQGFDYAQQVMVGADFDLDKLIGDQGGTFHFAVLDRLGRNLSSDYVGSTIGINGIYGGGQNFRLLDASYEQKWFGGRLDTLFGYLPPGSQFAGTPLLCLSLSNSVCDVPFSLILDSGFYNEPTAGWGGRIKYSIEPSLYVEAGIWEVNPYLDMDSNSGFDLGLNGATGSIVPVEIGKTVSLGPDNLIGHYRIGGYYDDSEVSDAAFPDIKRRGRYGGYILADQMVYSLQPGTKRGVILFGQATIGDARTSLTDGYYAAGAIVQGPFARRPDDSLDLFWTLAPVNTRITNATNAAAVAAGEVGVTSGYAEEIFELNYKVAVTPWLSLTPDVQYVVNPGALSEQTYPDAWVVSGQFLVTF
jgi:porin